MDRRQEQERSLARLRRREDEQAKCDLPREQSGPNIYLGFPTQTDDTCPVDPRALHCRSLTHANQRFLIAEADAKWTRIRPDSRESQGGETIAKQWIFAPDAASAAHDAADTRRQQERRRERPVLTHTCGEQLPGRGKWVDAAADTLHALNQRQRQGVVPDDEYKKGQSPKNQTVMRISCTVGCTVVWIIM